MENLNNTQNQPVYTIYEFESVDVVAFAPSGEGLHLSYIGCTKQEVADRAKALRRLSRRIARAQKQHGLKSGFTFKVLATTSDPEEAEKLETKFINAQNPMCRLNTVLDSFYTAVVKTAPDKLIAISRKPNHYSFVAEMRLDGKLCKKPFSSMRQFIDEYGNVLNVTRETAISLAKKDEQRW